MTPHKTVRAFWLTLINNERVSWQVIACDGTLISTEEEEDLWWVITDGINTSLVTDIKCSYLTCNLKTWAINAVNNTCLNISPLRVGEIV